MADGATEGRRLTQLWSKTIGDSTDDKKLEDLTVSLASFLKPLFVYDYSRSLSCELLIAFQLTGRLVWALNRQTVV